MDKKGLVSVTRIERYDADLLRQAVELHFDRLDVASLINPETRVLIKPNLLTGRDPQAAITTNPAVLQAIVDWLKGRGVRSITLADSPGGIFTAPRMKSIYNTCKMSSVKGVELNLDVGWQTRFRETGVVCKSFNLINPVCEADLIINVAKLKTHGMTVMSGGIKNLFGTIPGLQKPELHYLYPEKTAFSGMLVDLSLTVAPALTVIDAIEAMEGEGPSGGTVRDMGVLFASRDIYSQDWVAAKAMGLDPMRVEMIRIARERGLFDPDSITVEGELPENTAPFELPKSASLLFSDHLPGPAKYFKGPLVAAAKRLLHPVPRVIKDRCIGCGRCAESCPPHTITIKNKKAVIGLDKCISCFCCHEMCPVKAIDVKRRIGRL